MRYRLVNVEREIRKTSYSIINATAGEYVTA
jgi:hypothetical protein